MVVPKKNQLVKTTHGSFQNPQLELVVVPKTHAWNHYWFLPKTPHLEPPVVPKNQHLESPVVPQNRHLEPLVVAKPENGIKLAGAFLLRQAVVPLRRHHFSVTGARLLLCQSSAHPSLGHGTHFQARAQPSGPPWTALVRVSLRLGRAEISMYSHTNTNPTRQKRINSTATRFCRYLTREGCLLFIWICENLNSLKFPNI